MKVYVLLFHWQFGSLVRGVFTSLAGAWNGAQAIEDEEIEPRGVVFSPSPALVDEDGIPDRFCSAYGYQQVLGAQRIWQADMPAHLWSIEERMLQEK